MVIQNFATEYNEILNIKKLCQNKLNILPIAVWTIKKSQRLKFAKLPKFGHKGHD